MKIEHWHPKSVPGHSDKRRDYSHEQLDYSNLLAACMGGETGATEERHCDTHKGTDTLSLNPADPLHQIESMIWYKTNNGEIRSTNPELDRELDSVLHLNVQVLRTNRKKVLSGIQNEIRRQQRLHKGKIPTDWLIREKKKWNGENNSTLLRPYCQVVVYYISWRLRLI